MLVEAGAAPERHSTAEERRQAFELFVAGFSDQIATCPYHGLVSGGGVGVSGSRCQPGLV
jgi:hypothetical protein